MGPGTGEMMTPQADHALCGSDVIVGYPVYLKLLGGKYREKEFLATPMKQEVRRCEMCFEEAEKGKTVAMVCSGDAGVYGMASLLYEMSEAHPGCELEVIPGITAANSGAAALGPARGWGRSDQRHGTASPRAWRPPSAQSDICLTQNSP